MGKGRAKGYAEWKPRRGAQELVEKIEEVLDENREHLPLTARQIFYRLVASYGYPKDERAYERLTNVLNRARRSRMIPFDAIRDDGAVEKHGRYYENPEDFYGDMQRLGQEYKRDKLHRQPRNIRVMCEAAGMMPQLARVCRRYSVPVWSCSGFDSLTYKHDLARSIHDDAQYVGKGTIVLHLGDLDPSGYSIYESMREDVLRFVAEDLLVFPDELEDKHGIALRRVALEREHVNRFGLTTYPPKSSDGRSRSWIEEGLDTCQLEALPPDVLADVLADTIEQFLDPAILDEDRELEQSERRKITRALPSGS